MDTNINALETIGAWKSIQIASVDEIVTCPNILTNHNSNKITIVGDYQTFDFLPIVERISISDQKQRTSSGFVYKIKIGIDFDHASKEIDDYFSSYLNKKVIAIAQDNNGNEKIFGSQA